MKFKASVKDLSNALKRIMPFVGGEKAFENILISANNNELVIKAISGIANAKIKLDIESSDVFSFVIKGSEFSNMINTFNDFVNIELADSIIIISEKKSKIKLNTISDKNFPEKLSDVEDKGFEVQYDKLINGLEKAIDFVDVKSKQITSGINIDFNNNILTISGTDGNRASVTEIKTNSNINQNITIPLYIAKELIKNRDNNFKISISERFIKFDYDNFVIVSNLIAGKYPELKKLIPIGYKNKLKCKKNQLDYIIKKISLLDNASKKKYHFKMSLYDNTLDIDFVNNNHNSLNDSLDVEYTGENISIHLNYDYVDKAIKNCGEYVNFEFGEGFSPVLIKNDSNVMLIMPINVR